MLLSFLTKAYRSIVNLGCWIFAILLGIGMAIGFHNIFYEDLAAVGGFFVTWASLSRYEALECLPLLVFTLFFFAVFRIFPRKKLFIDSIWFFCGMIIGFVLITSLFGIPAEFYLGPFCEKINRTLLNG